MSTRLLIAYVLIVLLVSGLARTVWRMHYHSARQRMKRYYRDRREHAKR